MHLVNYNPTTNQVLGYIDPSMGFHGTDDGTAWFSIDDDIHDQYSQEPAWTDGKIITNIAPPNEFAVLTDDGWVIDDELKQNALKACKKEAKVSINDAVIAIYAKFNPLLQEYTLREQQALSFAESNYEGKVPHQIQAVVEPTGMTAKQATDSILSQSKKMHRVLEKLGELRMQKLAVDKMSTINDVNAHRDSVLQQIAKVAQQL